MICNFHPFQVLINIEDINDNLPLFDVADYNISIVEHIPNGFEIMQFHATDKVKLFNIVFGKSLFICNDKDENFSNFLTIFFRHMKKAIIIF